MADRSGSASPVTLDVEDRPTLAAPDLDRVVAAIASLTPQGGPGFAILSGPGGDYVQAAGGPGGYTAEWREHGGGGFEHWKAGRPGRPAGGRERIRTNGYHVDVQSHEVLSREDVVEIFTAFLEGRPRPAGFTWRSMPFPAPDPAGPGDTVH